MLPLLTVKRLSCIWQCTIWSASLTMARFALCVTTIVEILFWLVQKQRSRPAINDEIEESQHKATLSGR